MDWTVAKIFATLFPIAVFLLLPLVFTPKSSSGYIRIWSAYAIITTTAILSAAWVMANSIPTKHPQSGSPMSPIGNATLGTLIHALGFFLSIPMLLYILTLGLPWALKRWPHGRNGKGGEDGDLNT